MPVENVRNSKCVTIELSCPNHFDENDLACFWCNHSDQCRRNCEFENEIVQDQD